MPASAPQTPLDSRGDAVAGEPTTATTQDPTPVPATNRRRPRSATVLRWVHLLAGLFISQDVIFEPDGGWSDGFELFVGQVVATLVAWTGIIKWQLPRLRRWRARRRAGSSDEP